MGEIIQFPTPSRQEATELEHDNELMFRVGNGLPSTEEARLTNEALASARSSVAGPEGVSAAEKDLLVIRSASFMTKGMREDYLEEAA